MRKHQKSEIKIIKMDLPPKYNWLLDEPGPKIIKEFIKIHGIKEAPGAIDNPVIIGWAMELGIKHYVHDEIPWCGLAMAIMAKRAGKPFAFDPLRAKNWAQFGVKVKDGAKLGDVLVFTRKGGGHVGVYLGEDDECYHVGGGNQSDMVNIVRKEKSRIYAIRRPLYKVQPDNVRKIILSPDGDINNYEQ